jgi:DNA-directed RNA polymerase specialized sigma24 family protein
MRALLRTRGVPDIHFDDVIQEAWLSLLPKLHTYDGRQDFVYHAFTLAYWTYNNIRRSGHTKYVTASIDEQFDEGHSDGDRDQKKFEPACADTSYEESQMYNRFYNTWRRLPRKDKELFLGATEWGGKLRQNHVRRFPAVLNTLRSALLNELKEAA